MRKLKNRWLSGMLVMSLLPTVLKAQTAVIDAEIRPRAEFRDGYKTLTPVGKDAGAFTSQRTRLGLGYNSGLLNTKITIQDARIFGQNANASADATTGIYEAWAEVLIVPGGALKIGRQELKFDDNRLFSAPAWSNTGTAHDLALFKYQLNDWKVTTFLQATKRFLRARKTWDRSWMCCSTTK